MSQAGHLLDQAFYKQYTVSRGYIYSYYFRPVSTSGKFYLLFLHGFPSTSQDWAAQVHYFASKGCGLIVPDLLGYGGTSKPEDWRGYRAVDIARDVSEIADAVVSAYEANRFAQPEWKVVIIGHDWGAFIASRFIDLFPTHIHAAILLAVGYWPPLESPDFDLVQAMDDCQATSGTDRHGYWEVFGSDDGPALMEKQVESVWDMLFPDHDELWRTDMAPRGKARAWIEGGKRGEVPGWWNAQARREHMDAVMKHGGLFGPCAYYKCMLNGLQYDSDLLNLPTAGKHTFHTLFIAAMKDYICLPADGERSTRRLYAEPDKLLTVKQVDGGHWMMMEKPEVVNEAIEEFLKAREQERLMREVFLLDERMRMGSQIGYQYAQKYAQIGYVPK